MIIGRNARSKEASEQGNCSCRGDGSGVEACTLDLNSCMLAPSSGDFLNQELFRAGIAYESSTYFRQHRANQHDRTSARSRMCGGRHSKSRPRCGVPGYAVRAGPALCRRECDRRFRPQAIGISVRNIDDQNMDNPRFLLDQAKDVVSWCKADTNAPVILGGAGYSIFPETALSYLGADMGIRGDGEAAFPVLLARLSDGTNPSGLAGVFVAGHPAWSPPLFERDLDSFPVPDAAFWSAVDPSDPELWVPVQSRRGCPFGCAYCSTAAVQGQTRTGHALPAGSLKQLERCAKRDSAASTSSTTPLTCPSPTL